VPNQLLSLSLLTYVFRSYDFYMYFLEVTCSINLIKNTYKKLYAFKKKIEINFLLWNWCMQKEKNFPQNRSITKKVKINLIEIIIIIIIGWTRINKPCNLVWLDALKHDLLVIALVRSFTNPPTKLRIMTPYLSYATIRMKESDNF
jgi:hypothetical protein